MTIEVTSWEVAATSLGAVVAAMAPASGFVALYGPDAARIVDRVDADDTLADAGTIWTWGRAFNREREVVWRSEGARAVVVVARTATDEPLPDPLPAVLVDGRAPEGCELWSTVATEQRHPRLLLWKGEDLRILPLRLPESLSGAGGVAFAVEEYESADGLAWCRYVDLIEEG